MLNILIVEDEKSIRELLKIYFSRENHRVSEAENGKAALEKMKNEVFDVIILDIYMPELDGFDTCKEIRKFSNVPVIVLTALSDDESQLLAYEIGADDFITKPFKKDILLAKVRRISERINRSKNNYVFKGLEIKKDSYKVIIDNEEIKFAPKEFEILLFLVENKGIIKTRDDILSKIWGNDLDVYDRVVDNHIKKIRKKLGGYSDYLKTVISIGYKFEI